MERIKFREIFKIALFIIIMSVILLAVYWKMTSEISNAFIVPENINLVEGKDVNGTVLLKIVITVILVLFLAGMTSIAEDAHPADAAGFPVFVFFVIVIIIMIWSL